MGPFSVVASSSSIHGSGFVYPNDPVASFLLPTPKLSETIEPNEITVLKYVESVEGLMHLSLKQVIGELGIVLQP